MPFALARVRRCVLKTSERAREKATEKEEDGGVGQGEVGVVSLESEW